MKTNTPLGADFNVVHENSEFLLVLDLDQGNKSVTNDAEAVVEMLLNGYGNRRIFYYDSTNQIDELCHDGVRFTGFKFGMPEEFKRECGI